MAVSSGFYVLTMEKSLINTSPMNVESWEAEDNYIGLVTDTYAPNFDTHDFVDDITNEIVGGNYARETLDTTEITISPTGTLMFDGSDSLFDNAGSNDVTITNAEAAFHGFNVGTDATDPLGFLSDFGSPFSCTNSTFTVQWNVLGIWTIDLVP